MFKTAQGLAGHLNGKVQEAEIKEKEAREATGQQALPWFQEPPTVYWQTWQYQAGHLPSTLGYLDATPLAFLDQRKPSFRLHFLQEPKVVKHPPQK